MTSFSENAPLAQAQFLRSYSRRINGNRENWHQTCDRTTGALARLGKLNDYEFALINKMQRSLKALCSGRWLWVGGTDWVKKSENFYGGYNCSSTNVTDWQAFGLMMNLAMQGCGTGAVLEPKYISLLPPICNHLEVRVVGEIGASLPDDRNPDTDIFQDSDRKTFAIFVGDSRDGWVESYRTILELASDPKLEKELIVYVNLNDIRPSGEILKGFGGIANPCKLPELFPKIANILNGAIGRKLNSLECCLLIDEAALVVVAGNIRRCLPEDALVHTFRGLIPIKDVQIGDLVQTPLGFKKVTNKFDQGVQDVFEMNTNATNPRATLNHCVAILSDASGAIEWKQVQDLRSEDRLIHTTQILPGVTTSLPTDFTESRHPSSRTAKVITIPNLNSEIAWLIGLTHGDGYVALSRRSENNKPYSFITWAMNASDIELTAKIRAKIDLALKAFGLTAIHTIINGENTAKSTCHSIRLTEYFHKFVKQPNVPLNVPNFILQGSIDIRAAYLAGLMDSDGSINNRPPHLVTTVYQSFARQVCSVLSSLGIAGRLTIVRPNEENWRVKYNVTIPALKASYNALIAPHSVKGELRQGLKMYGFTVPAAMMRQVYTYSEMRSMGFQGSCYVDSNYERYIAESEVNLDIPVTFKGLGSYDSVQTYDIEVEEAHCFYCDGYLTHNSAGIRQALNEDNLFATAKDNLWQQDGNGSWRIDPTRDALRMSNHTRVFHRKPTLEECLTSVRSQYKSGEGAIMWAGEAIARANADVLIDNDLKRKFIFNYNLSKDKARLLLLNLLPEISDKELEHRLSRYGLNPCAEIIGSNFLCNLSDVHLNQIDPKNYNEQEEAFTAAALSAATLLNHKFSEERYQYSRELDPIVGVSFTGLFDFFVHAFGVEWLRWWDGGRPESATGLQFSRAEQEYLTRWKEIVHRVVWDYCDRNNLKRPNRCTTVQPAGSKSLLTNASPGWHPPKAQRFIRRMTFERNNPIALALRDYGYSIIPSSDDKDENGYLLDDIYATSCQTWLVEFPVEVSWANLPGADSVDISKFSALAQFDFMLQVQKYYVTHNCFNRSTEFLTDKGVRSFNDFEPGEIVNVLNKNGDWIDAEVVKTEDTRTMYEVLIREGKTGKEKRIQATGCHRFPVKRISGGDSPVKIATTLQLKVGHRLVTNFMDLPDVDDEGIRHGIAFGDGSLYRNNVNKDYVGCQLYLCGAKQLLKNYFQDYERTYERPEIDQTRIYGLPTHYKNLPDKDCSQSYLAGFFAGLLATDGNVCKSTISFSTGREEVVNFIKEQAPRLGIKVTSSKWYESNGYKESNGGFQVIVSKPSFPENLIIRPHHLEHYQSHESEPCQWRVVSVTELEEKDYGWCVMEPETNHFTLSDNILVMNTSATIELREDEIEPLALRIYQAIQNDEGYISAALLARYDAPFPRLPFEKIDKHTYDRLSAEVKQRRQSEDFFELLAKYDSGIETGPMDSACSSQICEFKTRSKSF